MIIQCPAFQNGQPIQARYTCDGKNFNPPLEFAEVPTGTASLALIVDDPDAPGKTFVHWLVWNLTPDTKAIAEGAMLMGATSGTTDFGETGYGGPCPPSGVHHYYFRLYALDTLLDLEPQATRPDLDQAMSGHILDTAEFMGTYARG